MGEELTGGAGAETGGGPEKRQESKPSREEVLTAEEVQFFEETTRSIYERIRGISQDVPKGYDLSHLVIGDIEMEDGGTGFAEFMVWLIDQDEKGERLPDEEQYVQLEEQPDYFHPRRYSEQIRVGNNLNIFEAGGRSGVVRAMIDKESRTLLEAWGKKEQIIRTLKDIDSALKSNKFFIQTRRSK